MARILRTIEEPKDGWSQRMYPRMEPKMEPRMEPKITQGIMNIDIIDDRRSHNRRWEAGTGQWCYACTLLMQHALYRCWRQFEELGPRKYVGIFRGELRGICMYLTQMPTVR
jgi:hypothetical protein